MEDHLFKVCVLLIIQFHVLFGLRMIKLYFLFLGLIYFFMYLFFCTLILYIPSNNLKFLILIFKIVRIFKQNLILYFYIYFYFYFNYLVNECQIWEMIMVKGIDCIINLVLYLFFTQCYLFVIT